LISSHTLLERVVTDSNGSAIFQSDLPCGKYYIRELEAPAGYLLDDTIHPIDASYTGQDGDASLHFSYTFTNDPIPPQETPCPSTPEVSSSPKVSASPGAVTGDDNSLALSLWCIFASLSLLILSGLAFWSKQRG